ncbi:cytochrome B [Betaproteobacteria bacterium PRO7]|nr:cytochrome B [Betaproteobacteria bacterium PRO7]
MTPVRIWDLPTRLFHWTLALLVVFSVTTAKIGGNWMGWHMRSGYAVLALLVFRLLWGFAGARYALFAQFVRGPRVVLDYLRAPRGAGERHAGHNPLGAWSVLALLAVLLVQGSTGLFANDEIATEGPLSKLVSGATASLMTRIHSLNQNVIYALVALHLAAIAYYFFAKRENLVAPMVTGVKRGIAAEPAHDDALIRARATVLALLAAGLVAYVVNL